MLTPIAAVTLLPFVDVIRSPHPPGVRFAWTRRWRKPDSNHWSREGEGA
jgi:hypothetical protein